LASKTLADEKTRKKFFGWLSRNVADASVLRNLDLQEEFGRDLTYSEAIEMALYKYPTIWREGFLEGYRNKVKQIVFVKELFPALLDGDIKVTYRKTPKTGSYYVIQNRFARHRESSTIFIEFYKAEKVNPYELDDGAAQLAGVNTADEIRKLFAKWYGDPIPYLFRNWFKVKQANELLIS
jgi:hypothetical protein